MKILQLIFIIFLLNPFIMQSKISKNTYCLFSHGVGGNYKQAYKYRDVIPYPLKTFDYPDAFHFPKLLPRTLKNIPRCTQTSLAQENELNYFIEQFDKLEQELQEEHGNDYNIVLYGLSRGASVLILFMALYPEKLSHVSAVIMESPFCSVGKVISNFRHRFYLKRFISQSMGHRILESIFMKYNRNYPSPATFTHNINNHNINIPILIIASQKDKIVPFESSKKLYDILATKDVHFLELEDGEHACLLQSSQKKHMTKYIQHFLNSYL